MRKLTYCLLAFLWPVLNCFGQTSSGNIRPLTIGDTLPDITLTNVYNYPVSKIRLSDLKGKLIILDFWGKYCAPCIKALPKLDSLQKIFKNQIQVITISDFTNKGDLLKAKKRFTPLKNINLPLLLVNEQLSEIFPHKILSHVVWISPEGVVKAFTGTDYLTAENIRHVLNREKLDWTMKIDALDFDYRKPLLTFTQANIVHPSSLYYSAFTSYIDGIAPPSGTEIAQSRGVSVTSFYNYDILSFCQLALDFRTGAERGQFILQVRDTSRYIQHGNSNKQKWKRENTYCYYLQLPATISMEETKKYVQRDILRWLEIMGIRVKKEMQRHNEEDIEQYIITEIM